MKKNQANETVKIEIGLPQVPRGSANKYAWKTNRATARVSVGGASVIIAATGRLLSWKSGNLGSSDKRTYNNFVAKWDREISAREAIELIPSGVPGSRAVRIALRNSVYNAD